MFRVTAATPEDLEAFPDSFLYDFFEIQKRVNAFLDSISDPSNPCFCPYCFGVLAYDLQYNDIAWEVIQQCAHSFMEACLRLLVVYTETNIPQLRERLRQRQMSCGERAWFHKRRLYHPTSDPINMLLDAMLSLVGSALTRGLYPVYSNSKKFFHKRKGRWPLDVAQLFPLGVERGIDSLIHWCCVPPSGFPFSMLSTFTVLARTVVLPKLLDPPRRERFARALLQAITPGTSAVPWGGPPPFAVPAGLCVPRGLRGTSLLADPALGFLSTLRLDIHARAGDGMQFLAGFEQVFLDALERFDQTRPVEEHFDPVAICEIRRFVVGDYGCAMRTALGRPHNECDPGLHAAPSAGRFVGLFLVRRRDSRYCASPDCMNSELDEGRLFQKCASCRFVRYCGRDCQRQDWKEGTPTHRAVCPTLRKLLHAVDSSASAEEFEDRYAECGLDEKDVELLTQWASAGKLVPLLEETEIL